MSTNLSSLVPALACMVSLAAAAVPVTNVTESAGGTNVLQRFVCDASAYVPLSASTAVTVECPDASAAKWLEAHLGEWYGAHAPKVKAGSAGLKPPSGPEAYAAAVDGGGVRIAANALAGVRWAAYTLRQQVIAKRGTLKTEGYILPQQSIEDRPHLAFRAVHLCCFPETRIQQIERAIRLAALLKFNYAIIEPWGMYRSEKHPWWAWPNAYLTKAEVKRLVAVGRDLGITLIPQINCYGHASASRGCTVKHCALDLSPEYEPVFEPGGWNWCLSNPETQRVLRDLVGEIHEDFGNPPFFHLGCDEAEAQTCPECVKTPNAELVIRHITGLVEFVKSRGARAMMWHDMLIDSADPRWKGFVKCGGKHATDILDKLPRDVVICDWQYYSSNKETNEPLKDWPTMTYFAEKGFPVVCCPWLNFDVMKPMADHIVKIGGFGIIETTWHHMRGKDWEKMFINASRAAWGSPVSHGISFQRSLRMVGYDMKVTDYLDTGHLNNQVSPSWWAN